MIKTKRICAGLYEYTDKYGRKWIIEHVTKNEGFAFDEWHVGTEDDPHSDQYNTKRECIYAIEKTIEKTDECQCGGALTYRVDYIDRAGQYHSQGFICNKCGKTQQTPTEREKSASSWFDSILSQSDPGHQPHIDYDDLVDDMTIEYTSDSTPIYICIPDDPDYVISRAYRGANIGEIIQKMRDSGWVITGLPSEIERQYYTGHDGKQYECSYYIGERDNPDGSIDFVSWSSHPATPQPEYIQRVEFERYAQFKAQHNG